MFIDSGDDLHLKIKELNNRWMKRLLPLIQCSCHGNMYSAMEGTLPLLPNRAKVIQDGFVFKCLVHELIHPLIIIPVLYTYDVLVRVGEKLQC